LLKRFVAQQTVNAFNFVFNPGPTGRKWPILVKVRDAPVTRVVVASIRAF
jgi:hypothetical protein